MQNLGYAKAQIVSKYRFLTPKNILNHWLLTLSVRFCPKYALTPAGFKSPGLASYDGHTCRERKRIVKGLRPLTEAGGRAAREKFNNLKIILNT
jgi:hypothetical protein